MQASLCHIDGIGSALVALPQHVLISFDVVPGGFNTPIRLLGNT